MRAESGGCCGSDLTLSGAISWLYCLESILTWRMLHESMWVILFVMNVCSFVRNRRINEALVWGLMTLTDLPHLTSHIWGLVASLREQSRSYSGQKLWIESTKFTNKADRYEVTFCNVCCANHWHSVRQQKKLRAAKLSPQKWEETIVRGCLGLSLIQILPDHYPRDPSREEKTEQWSHQVSQHLLSKSEVQ